MNIDWEVRLLDCGSRFAQQQQSLATSSLPKVGDTFTHDLLLNDQSRQTHTIEVASIGNTPSSKNLYVRVLD